MIKHIIRKRVWFLLGIIVLCGLFQVISFAQESEFDYKQAIERATELYNEKKYEESIKSYQEALEIEDTDSSVYYNIACCYSLMNKVEDALDWLEKSIIHGFTNYGHIKNDTDLENIRNTPKFKELIAKYNLIIEEKTDTFILKGFDPYTTANGYEQTLTSYCYLVGCPKNKEAVIIDPSGGEREIKKYLKATGLNLKYILITHFHEDQIRGIKVWLEEFKPKVYIHEASIERLKEYAEYDNVVALKDGDKIEVGILSFKVMHTPAHTPDSVCFYLEKEGRLFSGDALTFIPGHITPEISKYFQKYFSGIKDETKIYSGRTGYNLFSDIKKIINSVAKTNNSSVKQNYCDLKKTESVFKCDKCNKILAYYYCPKCNKDALTTSVKINENEATVIPCKCPDCGTKIIRGSWLKDDKCGLCGVSKSGQYILFCVKSVYACPAHKDFESLKSGNCSKVITDDKGKETKCDQKFEEIRIVYSPRIYMYECPKCKIQTNKSGRCARCRGDKTRIRTCKDSGTFPHVSEEQWEKENSK